MTDVFTVSSSEELYEAIAACTGGETILLEGGDYGSLVLTPYMGLDIIFTSNVTIASADPGNPAVFETMGIVGAENLTLEGLYFDYTFSEGDPDWYRPFQINVSSNITVKDCTFDGDVAVGVSEVNDGFGYAHGLSVRDSSDIMIEGNEFFGFAAGMSVGQTDNIDVIGNDIHSMRRDGMTFVEVNNITISENYIHDFAATGDPVDHCDMIQFWTNGTDSPSSNILIDNNILDIGDGTFTQTIFMMNEEVELSGAGAEMFYQDVTITNNVIVNGHLHGITVGETNGLMIQNNTVVHSDGGADDGLDSEVEIPMINVAESSTNVTIDHNITAGVTGLIGQQDWTVTDNVFVQDQDPNGVNYYDDVFITSTLVPENGVHAFVAVPGGVIETMGAGAPSTLSPEIDGVVEAQFQIAASADNAAVRQFDATQTLTTLDVLPEGTTFEWDFGDGSTATGAVVSHSFPDGGVFSVVLTVTLPDGTSDSQSIDVGIEDPVLVSLQDGQILSYDLGQATEIGSVGSTGIVLPDTGAALEIDRSHFAEIEGADDVSINFTIEASSTDNGGEVVRLHMSFYATVRDSGELQVNIYDPDGNQYAFVTSGAGLNDLEAHDISINLSGENLEISVDGAVVGTGVVPGGMGYSGGNAFAVGNPWGSPNYDGAVTAFEITANADDFVAQPVGEEPPVEEPNPDEPPIVEPPVEGPPTEPNPEDPSETPTDPPVEAEPEASDDDGDDPVPAPEDQPETPDQVEPVPPNENGSGRPDFSFIDKVLVREFLVRLFSNKESYAEFEKVPDSDVAAFQGDFQQQAYHSVESLSLLTTDDWML